MKKIITFGIIVIALIVVSTYAGLFTEEPKETITLGAIVSLTGVAAPFGEMSQKAINLAVEEINENGGIDGRPVQVIIEDDVSDPKTAAGLYQKLTSVDGVPAIIGSNFDFVTQPLFGLAETGPAVVVSPSNPRIAGAFDTNAQSFVMMSDFEDIIVAFESYLNETPYERMAIVRFDSAFSQEITENLNEMIVADGKEPLMIETYKQIGANDFRTTILKLKEAQIDLVFIDMVATDPGVFMKQAKELGYTPTVLTHVGLADALGSEQFDSSLFEGVIALDWNVSPNAFVEKFERAYGVKPTNSANRAYDAVYLLAEAVSEAGNDSVLIAKYMREHSFETPNGAFAFTAEHSAEQTEVELRVVRGGVLVSRN